MAWAFPPTRWSLPPAMAASSTQCPRHRSPASRLARAATSPSDPSRTRSSGSTGQNAMHQAKYFTEAVGVTGVVLAKLDGTAKGGVIFSICDQLGVPVRFVGTGERPQDLAPFEPRAFVEALFAP